MISHAFVTVQCDNCIQHIDIEITWIEGGKYDNKNVRDELPKRKWIYEHRDLQFCSKKCQNNHHDNYLKE